MLQKNGAKAPRGDSTSVDFLAWLLAPHGQGEDLLARPAEVLRRDRRRRLFERRLEAGANLVMADQLLHQRRHGAGAELRALLEEHRRVREELLRLPREHRRDVHEAARALAGLPSFDSLPRVRRRRDRLSFHRALAAVADARAGAHGRAFYPLVRVGGAA